MHRPPSRERPLEGAKREGGGLLLESFGSRRIPLIILLRPLVWKSVGDPAVLLLLLLRRPRPFGVPLWTQN